jgi:thiopeptide-type bacteriocin biosynthesis protein
VSGYRFLDRLLLRAPYFSFARYAPERLEQVLADPAFRRALLLASPGFYGLLQKKSFCFEDLSEKERFTLLKYYNRMSFRPTPFGSFASFSVVKWADGRVSLDYTGGEKLHLAYDREWQINQFSETSDLSNGLVCLSPLLYRLGREFRFWRRLPQEAAGKFAFGLDAISADSLTVSVVKKVSGKALPPKELAGLIMELSGCSLADAEGYLTFLLKEQVFCPVRANSGLIQKDQALLIPKEHGPEEGTRYYAALERTAGGGPSAADRERLEKAVAALQLMCIPTGTAESPLEQFRSAFAARFGEQKVPLLKAVDPDAGIAYEFPDRPVNAIWTAIHQLFLRLWLGNPLRTQYQELVLDDEALSGIAGSEKSGSKFPPTTSVLFRRAGGRLLVEHAGGATATALVGRFSLFSDEVLSLCKEAAGAEARQNPDVIFADINGVSGLHVDNINLRRQIYAHAITMDAVTATPASGSLLPSDLLVSVRKGELVLESVSLRKRIIPRLSTAFNHRHNGLGLFRLLCDLQYQGLSARLNFDLESLFPGLNFYPRVSYGNCVLAPAKWKLSAADIPFHAEAISSLRERFDLPSVVSLGRGDQQLVFDLNEAADVVFFLSCLRGESTVALTEYLLSDRGITSGHKPIAGQYLGLLAFDETVYEPLPVQPARQRNNVKRTFLPGTEWLYVKLYCAEASAARVLQEILAPFLTKNKQLILQWFFVRYTDPDPHIRIRLLIRETSAGTLLSSLASRARTGVRKDLIRAFRIDTYERELERYGAALIAGVEEVFHKGSEVTLAALKAGLPELATSFAIILKMTGAFLGNPALQTAFAANSAGSFMKEFNIGKNERVEMDTSYRQLRPELSEILSVWPLSRSMTALLRSLKKVRAATGHLTDRERLRLLSDLAHMQINRSFHSDQRRQELYVWFYLHKFLAGQAAINKKAGQK